MWHTEGTAEDVSTTAAPKAVPKSVARTAVQLVEAPPPNPCFLFVGVGKEIGDAQLFGFLAM
jgi:hypothetical protein